MIDKFQLTLKENVFLAKKLIAQSIYDSARLEGCNITFPETETILNGVSIAGLKMSDVEVVLNLRDAWKFVLNTIEEPLTLDYCNKINGFVARNESLEWGTLRNGKVSISGTSYVPKLPDEADVIKSIDAIINSDKSATERGIDLFLYGCRSQNYWDGNKRSSKIIANKFLIMNGAGLLSIPDAKLLDFSKLLSDYYEYYDDPHTQAIKKFLYDTSIKGLEISNVE